MTELEKNKLDKLVNNIEVLISSIRDNTNKRYYFNFSYVTKTPNNITGDPENPKILKLYDSSSSPLVLTCDFIHPGKILIKETGKITLVISTELGSKEEMSVADAYWKYTYVDKNSELLHEKDVVIGTSPYMPVSRVNNMIVFEPKTFTLSNDDYYQLITLRKELLDFPDIYRSYVLQLHKINSFLSCFCTVITEMENK